MPIGDKYIDSVFSCTLNTEKLLALRCYSQNFHNITRGKEVPLLEQLKGCIRLNGTCDKI